MCALLIVILWAGYEHFNKRIIVYPVRRASDGGDRLTETINVLYTFEVELSEMYGTAASVQGEQGEELIFKSDPSRIEELESLGYHFRVEEKDRTVFSNLDNEDLVLLSEVTVPASEGVFWSEKGLLIRSDISVMERLCHVTCVYNRERVDRGVENSQTMLYIVPRGLSQVMLISAVICFAVMIWTTASPMKGGTSLKRSAWPSTICVLSSKSPGRRSRNTRSSERKCWPESPMTFVLL